MEDLSRRRYKRFGFRYGIRIKLHGNAHDILVNGITKNISAGGVLLESPTEIKKRSPVSFTIVAHGGAAVRPIEFTGEGKVVRIEPEPRTTGYAIAVKCIEPIQFHPFERKTSGG